MATAAEQTGLHRRKFRKIVSQVSRSDEVTPQVVPEVSANDHGGEAVDIRGSLWLIWALARPFLLCSPQRKRIWALIGCGVAFLLLESWIMVKFSYVKRDYNSALQQKNQEEFWTAIYAYGGIIACIIVLASLQGYASAQFSLAWRHYLVECFLRRYLSGRTFYTMQLGSPMISVDNPDQRIAEDTTVFVEQTVVLFTVVIDSVMTIASMSAVLLTISEDLCIFLLVYSAGGTFVTVRIFGHRLMLLARRSISQTANIRFYLIRLREHAESVAFYGGQNRELVEALQRVDELFRTLMNQTYWSLGLVGFNKVYKYSTFVLPVILVAPRYFRGDVEFGVVAQTSQAFIQILFALSVFVSKFESISTLGARVMRLERLSAALDAAEEIQYATIERRDTEAGMAVGVSSLFLYTPNAQTCICKNLNLKLAFGDSCLVMGESGIGKSSLLRALAGLWTRGSGTISLSTARNQGGNTQRPFFLSQQCYMTLGSLRDQVLFPVEAEAAEEQGVRDDDIKAALDAARVPLHHRFPLDAQEDWGGMLSMGEQQRLAFARVFLHRPALVFLDESTSAMDLVNERHMYSELRQRSQSYVSVGHRQSLLEFHNIILYGGMSNDGPSWRVQPVSEFSKA